jgi:hypothetical protein
MCIYYLPADQLHRPVLNNFTNRLQDCSASLKAVLTGISIYDVLPSILYKPKSIIFFPFERALLFGGTVFLWRLPHILIHQTSRAV